MNKKIDAFRRIILKRIIAFMLISVLAMLSYVKLLTINSSLEYESSLLVNLLGRQRMLTQQIAKDANRLYVLIQALESGNIGTDVQTVNQAVRQSRKALLTSRDGFGDVIEALSAGSVVLEQTVIEIDHTDHHIDLLIRDISRVWSDFETAVTTVASAGSIDDSFAQALIHINANNLNLMHLSDDFTSQMISKYELYIRSGKRVSMIILLIAVLVLIAGIFWLYQFIIYPLDELYQQLSITGLEQPVGKRHRLPVGKASASMIMEVRNAFERLRSLIVLIENINHNVSFEEVLHFIYRTFSPYVPYSYIGIALLKEDDTVLEASYGISDQSMDPLRQKMEGISTKVSESSLGQILTSKQARLINDYGKYLEGRPVKDYSRYVLEAGIKSSITLPLHSNEKAIGIIFFSSKIKNAYTSSHLAFLKTLTNSIAISFEKSIFVDQLLYSSILAMARLTEARDEDTGDHLERIKHYTRTIAVWLRRAGLHLDILTTAYIDDLARFSPLHDIGKVGISDSILLKPGRLTKEEFAEMQKHTDYGANVLAVAEKQMQKTGRSMFGIGIEIVSGHHEKWNGSGYPQGLSGTNIPLSARIVAIADVFDALTSKRPYKEAYSFQEAVERIKNGRGSHFDPEIIDVFLSDIYRLESAYHQIRENGKNLSFS